MSFQGSEAISKLQNVNYLICKINVLVICDPISKLIETIFQKNLCINVKLRVN